MTPNESLVELLEEGIDDANDYDANFTTLARGAARTLTDALHDSDGGIDLPFIVSVLEDYIDLQMNGHVDSAGRYPVSDVDDQVDRLTSLLSPEPDA